MTQRTGATRGGNDRGETAASGLSEREALAAAAAMEIDADCGRDGLYRFGTLAPTAWDILLTLYREQTRDDYADLYRLAETGRAATTTNLRVLGVLIDEGLARVLPGGGHGKAHVALSEQGMDEVEHLLRGHLAAWAAYQRP